MRPNHLTHASATLFRAPALVAAISGILLTLALASIIVLTVAKRRAPAPAPAVSDPVSDPASDPAPAEGETSAILLALAESRVYDADAGSFVKPAGASASAVPAFPRFLFSEKTNRLFIDGPEATPFIQGRYWIQSVPPSNPASGGVQVPGFVRPVTICLQRETREAIADKHVFLWFSFSYRAE